MTRWWTSDLHLGHANVIGYTGRPFPDPGAMNRGLIDTWNGLVDPSDEVWVLGDFAMGRIADTLPLAGALAGRKVLVPGNHDRCWVGAGRRRARWREAYADAGFEVVDGPVELDLAGTSVLADHFPYHGDSQDRDRFVEHRPHDRGGWLLHGHVHDKWRQEGRMINVGVDAWGGRPVAETELVELISAGPARRPPQPWPAQPWPAQPWPAQP